MDIKKVTVCPLGGTCEKIVGNEVHVCAWQMSFEGTNPQTQEKSSEKGCAMNWIPLLLVENTMQQKSTAAAVESFRNEMVEANLMALGINFRPLEFDNLKQVN